MWRKHVRWAWLGLLTLCVTSLAVVAYRNAGQPHKLSAAVKPSNYQPAIKWGGSK